MSSKERIHIDDWEVTDVPHILPYGHNRGSAVINPDDMGRVKGLAMKAMYQQADIQMDQIKEQIDLLASQAKAIQDRIRISEEIYEVEMSFEPVISQIYHLYERDNKTKFLSPISPNEWGRKSSLKFIATVRLLGDRSWALE